MKKRIKTHKAKNLPFISQGLAHWTEFFTLSPIFVLWPGSAGCLSEQPIATIRRTSGAGQPWSPQAAPCCLR